MCQNCSINLCHGDYLAQYTLKLCNLFNDIFGVKILFEDGVKELLNAVRQRGESWKIWENFNH